MKKIIDFIKDEDGLETPEYAVMGALIVIGLVTAVTALKDSVVTTFGDMQTAIGTR